MADEAEKKKPRKKDIYLKNNKELPVDVQIDWEPWQLEEFKKCKDDIEYFAENYFTIVHPDDGKIKMALYEPQKRAIRKIVANRNTIICASRQVGKLLFIDTPVPTPHGWTTMGALKDGDVIFGWNGNPCKVLKAHDVTYSKQAYEITFSNGEKILAGEEHEWFTEHRSERKKGLPGSVKTTQQIYDTLLYGIKEPEPAHRIPYKHCVQYEEKDLPIDPYLFGYWLGDGAASKPALTVGKHDYDEFKLNFAYLTNLSEYNIKDRKKAKVIGIKTFDDGESFLYKIKKLNVFNNKHIPQIYLQSSEEQRMELLKGLLDTDGTCQKNGVILFYSSISQLADNVEELLNSLGIQCKRTQKIGKLYGVEHKICHMLTFKTERNVFKLKRKSDRQFIKLRPNTTKSRNNFIYIKDIKPIDPVPMRCITVDTVDQMYLIGKSFISTHNTSLMTVVCLWYAMFNKNFNIAILANQERMALEILSRIKTAYKGLPNWLKAGVPVWSQGQVTFSNESNIFASTTSENSIRGQTVNILFLDEFAFVPPEVAEGFFASVVPAISASKKSKMILVSTPNGTQNKYYQIYAEALAGKDADGKPTKWALDKIHWREIPGRDDAWAENMLAMIGGDRDKWNQEFELMFLTNGQTALNAELLKRLKSQCRQPLYSFDEGDYVLFYEPGPNKIISIGVDVSEGVGQDWSVAQILDITDPEDIKHCGIFASNSMTPYVFAEKLNQIARSWGRPFLCIERNGPGGQVIDALINVHNYDNIVTASKVNDSEGRYNKQIGIVNHQNNKLAGNLNLRHYLENLESVKPLDIKTLNEFDTYVRKNNRTWGALKGFNDDRIMGLIWALFLLEKSVAEKHLNVLEYDESGQVVKISDPNQDLANNLLAEGSKKVAYARLGGQPPPSIFQFGQISSYKDAEIAGYMNNGFTFV